MTIANGNGWKTYAYIVGWKTYLVAAAAIIAGCFALAKGHTGDGWKGIIAGFALIALRDAIGKILQGIEGNRRALDNLRAAIDTHWNKNTSRG